MATSNPGRESRSSRVTQDHPGAWGSSSQDFVRLASLLLENSAIYAENADGNCSIYPLAGIPMLFSALHCLLIELNAGMLNASANADVLRMLAKRESDVRVIAECYPTFPLALLEELKLLLEIRNEILHPAHRPGPEKSNTPAYLSQLRRVGLLQSTGKELDYIWLSQLQSHGLFQWAFNVARKTVEALLRIHKVPPYAAAGILETFSRHEDVGEDL